MQLLKCTSVSTFLPLATTQKTAEDKTGELPAAFLSWNSISCVGRKSPADTFPHHNKSTGKQPFAWNARYEAKITFYQGAGQLKPTGKVR